MTFVALGATLVAVSRFHGSHALRPAIAIHLFVYTYLYLLFVGAVLHAAAATPRNDLSLLKWLDLVLSVAPMLTAVRIGIAALAGGGDAPNRW
jgi:hypothetical protein